MTSSPACIAFEGGKRLAAGAVADVALAVRKRAGGRHPILVFDYDTGRQIELDLRGTDKDIRTRLMTPPVRRTSA